MSTTSLPSYVAPSFGRTPTYTAEPQASEQRLALNRLNVRPSADFVKQSKSGGISLRLTDQDENTTLPTYGTAASIEGAVNVAKPDGVASVEIKLEGSLKLKEIAEGGTTSNKLCLSTLTLWSRESSPGPCPNTLTFALSLPLTFFDGKNTYPLPPTHEVHLSGVPGFRATIEYSLAVVVNKTKSSSLLRAIASSSVSTPFIYYPRSRPASPLPRMLLSPSFGNPNPGPEWMPFESVIKSRSPSGTDIQATLYLPQSRVFCMRERIPFHFVLQSSAFSLAAFLPYGPTMAMPFAGKQHTKIQLLRQSSVDVRNTTILGTKTDIWRVDLLGQGSFTHAGDGPDWTAFSGEIAIGDVKVPGFKASGLTVKDCIVLSMMPPEPTKAPFTELRIVVPIRLTTDPWSDNGMGDVFASLEYSDPSVPDFSDYRENNE